MFALTTRAVLLTCAGVIGTAVVVDKTVTRIPAFLTVLQGEPLPPLSGGVDSATVIREGIWIALALVALGCVLAADGPRVVGLTVPLRQCGFVFGAWVAMVPVVLVSAVVMVGLVHLMGVAEWVGNHGVDPDAVPLWYWIYKSAMAGIVEEIIVVAVAFRLLEVVPVRSDGRRFIDTSWAMGLFIFLRVSYHCYYGLGMIVIALTAWLVIRLYRHNRALLPLIVAHSCYDFAGTTTAGRMAFLTAGAAALYFCTPRPLNLRMVLLTPFGFLTRQQSRPTVPAPTASA